MSTTYEFYAGRKTAGGKIEAIGPYARREDDYHLIPIFERSRSFINWDEFDGCKISPEEFTNEQKDYFTTDVWCGDERYSLATFIPYSHVCSLSDDGIEQGYVTLDELDSVAKSGYDPDVLWDIWVRSPEMIAEMDAEERKGFGHIAFIDHCSTGYSINEDIFMDKVGQISVKQIVRTAKERGGGSRGFAETMMLAYNSKNKYRLSMRKLYGKKSAKYESGDDDGDE